MDSLLLSMLYLAYQTPPLRKSPATAAHAWSRTEVIQFLLSLFFQEKEEGRSRETTGVLWPLRTRPVPGATRGHQERRRTGNTNRQLS